MPPSRPMPSFTLVLTSNPAITPGPSVVIDSDTPASSAVLPTAPAHFMKTIDLRDEPMEGEQFSFNLRDESATYVGYDETDAQTIFEERRPITSREFHAQEDESGSVRKYNLSLLLTRLRKLKLLRTKATDSFMRRALLR